jgi:hypothetical protein
MPNKYYPTESVPKAKLRRPAENAAQSIGINERHQPPKALDGTLRLLLAMEATHQILIVAVAVAVAAVQMLSLQSDRDRDQASLLLSRMTG